VRLRRLLPLPLVGALAALAFTSPTRAAGLPSLVVHRTEDAADCPDARALATLVAEQMKRPALAPAGDVSLGPDRGLDVQIYRSDQGFTAVVQAGGKTRQLSDKGPSCGGLTAALAVSIAVMLDTEPLPPEPEPPPSPAPLPEPPPTDLSAPVPSPPASASTPTSAPAPVDDRIPEVHRFHVSLAVSPVITDGVLRPGAAGVTSELEVRFGRFSVSGGVLALPGQTITFAPGEVTLSLTSGFLRGCGALVGDGDSLRLSLCVEPSAGAIRGVGQGYRIDRTLSVPWAAAGASAAFQQRIVGPLSWGARAGLVIPLLKQSFVVDNVGTAFTPAPAGGALDVGLRVSIW
jgi:hypothetical protein